MITLKEILNNVKIINNLLPTTKEACQNIINNMKRINVRANKKS